MISESEYTEVIIEEPRYSWPRPAVIRVGRVSCHQGRTFSHSVDTENRYLVGRQYWRLLSYLQGLWPSLYGIRRIPHLAVTGISGSGKSWTVSAAVSFLRQSRLEPSFRVVSVADCAVWLDSADPLSFFCMEVMLALRNDICAELNMVKSRLISHPDEIRPWLMVIDDWLDKSNLKMLVFLDQIEALLGKPETIPNLIIQSLIDMKRTVVVMAMTVDGPSERSAIANWGFSRLGFHHMIFPFSIPATDYSYLSDLLFDCPLSLHESALLREVRLYTGGIIRELVQCLTFGAEFVGSSKDANGPLKECDSRRVPKIITGVDLTTRIEAYRRSTIDNVANRIESILIKLDRVQRVAFLLVIFRMILRLPADAATSSVNLPSDLRSLFLPAAIQKFYHPRDSVACILHIPTAVSHSVHLALSSNRVLQLLADRPLQVMHKLISSIMDAKTVCNESKRRLVRFYAIHRLSGHHQVKLAGLSDFDRTIEVDTGHTFIVHHFAGLSPAKDIIAWLLAQAIVSSEGHVEDRQRAGMSELSRAVPIILLPGRTDYCFFDYFVFNPGQKKLFAVSTAASPSDWQKGGSKNSVNHGSVVTPSTLIEMWRKVIQEVFPIKFTIHCVSVKPSELLNAADCPWKSIDI